MSTQVEEKIIEGNEKEKVEEKVLEKKSKKKKPSKRRRTIRKLEE